MKKSFYTFIVFIIFSSGAYAQRCSTITAAIPSGTGTTSTFDPTASDLPCIDSGGYVSDTIYLYNGGYNSFGLLQYTILDSINNLPSGLCWETNAVGDSIPYGGQAVILISGTCTDTIGRYQLDIKITEGMSGNVLLQDADASSLWGHYFLQVKHATDTCPTLDTTYIVPTVTATISPDRDTVLCAGATITLTANAGAGYQYMWSTGDTTRSITVGAGSYTVTVNAFSGSAFVAQGVSGLVSIFPDRLVSAFNLLPDTANPHRWLLHNTSTDFSPLGGWAVYSWDWGDASTSTGADTTHTYASQGAYTICLTSIDQSWGCSVTYCDTAIQFNAGDSVITYAPVSIPFGINGVTSAGNINLYPNPNKGWFTLQTADCLGKAYMITDMIGNVIAHDAITADRQVIDLKEAAEGVYTLAVFGTAPIRFVIVR